MLRDGLTNRQHTQSKVDPFLGFKSDFITVVHVEICIMFAKDYDKVKAIIKCLEKDFKLTDEGDLSACLRIDVAKK